MAVGVQKSLQKKYFLKDNKNSFSGLKSPSQLTSFASTINNRKILYPQISKLPEMKEINSHFRFIDKSDLLFKVADQQETEKKHFDVFWVSAGRKVRLVHNESSEIPEYEGKNLIKIYGRTKIKFFNYIVTENYFGFTL